MVPHPAAVAFFLVFALDQSGNVSRQFVLDEPQCITFCRWLDKQGVSYTTERIL